MGGLVRALWMTWLVVGCEDLPGAPPPTDRSDTDTDTDSDADTDSDTDADTTSVGMQRKVDLGTARSDNGGHVTVEFDLGPNDTSFLLFGASDEVYLSVDEVIDPGGARVVRWQDFNGDESLTDSFYPFTKDVAFNWPMRDIDGPLRAGTWAVKVATTDADYRYVGSGEFTANVRIKQDPNFSTADVTARIVYTGGLEGDGEVVAAIEGAVERWREIWADHGIALQEYYDTANTSADLPYPDFNSFDIFDVSQALTGQEVQLLVGELVDGDPFTYGIAGGIPGPLDPSTRSAVVVSWLAHAGQNGSFDADEIRLMGETFAHEIGHYMGLQHPVQMGWNDYDALDDTDNCGSSNSCAAALGDNLMYPVSLCGGGYCDPQYKLTNDQEAELHRNAAAL